MSCCIQWSSIPRPHQSYRVHMVNVVWPGYYICDMFYCRYWSPSLTHEDRTNHHHQKQVDQKWGLLIASTATSSLSSLPCSACLQSLKFGISRVYLLLRWSRCIIVVVLAVSESEGVNAWPGLGWSWWLVVSLVAHKSRYTTARPLAAAGHSPNYNQLSSRIVALLIIYTRPEVSTQTDIDIYTHINRHLHTARDIYTHL